MKEFVLMTVGFTEPPPEIMASGMQWFASIKSRGVQQVGFMDGRCVRGDEVVELTMDSEALTGFLVIQAEDMNEAVDVAGTCPAVSGTRVHKMQG